MDYEPPAQVEKQKPEGQKQEPKKKADIHQESTGAGSPNIVTGDHSTVNISAPAGSASPVKQPRFREKVDRVAIYLGSSRMSFPIKQLLDGTKVTPLKFGETGGVWLYIEKGVVYIDVSIPGGGGLPPVEVKHNEFVRPPFGWDRNSDESALEFVDLNHNAVFQLIYVSDFEIQLRGAMMVAPGMLLIANENGFAVNPRPPMVVPLPRTIFKYPSSSHPGERR